MIIKSFKGGTDDNFSYLLTDESTGATVIMDPSTDPAKLKGEIDDHQYRLEALLITHTHFDHIMYVDHWTQMYPALAIITGEKTIGATLPSHTGLSEGNRFNFGRSSMQLIETPGHYPDSVCWHDADSRSLFTGDTIFVGRPGRTVGPLSDTVQLYESIYDKLLKLPGSTKVYPGHDYGPDPIDTLDGLVQKYPFFRCREKGEFVDLMADYELNRVSGS